ncbi:Pkinase-domain-containing protein [Basidiobolus meristosporus CBS 931.73]|uniref:Pkinase-domain-containing protein n=1 Tax=Basidiobolus meristosporus CBS 931.73 TaxID=1314790 RepID=A0A1Y1X4J6_9FUNG|nr:Pkinase-domain-containing protein [Basidiobolus meristosporus CBS 931.73]|eukprot:ORX80741.1 Pkinase-domain-containing protein [Basidiobolus meristosporus CBS 931.73]
MMKQIKSILKSATSVHEPTSTSKHASSVFAPLSPEISMNSHSNGCPIHKAPVKSSHESEPKGDPSIPLYPDLDRYKLLEKLGDGAFSNVYKAWDRTCQKLVAVKVVRKFQLNAIQRGNVLKEATIMRNISHPNVAKLLDFKDTKDFYYLVLELLGGGEIFHRIVKLTYFSEALARHVILQVAQGIRYLHEEKGVVHRDIKPENLLFQTIPYRYGDASLEEPSELDEEKLDEGDFIEGIGGGGIGVVKIADFGLSKVVWNSDTMTPCGTVGYTAPEVVRDERYSKSVDMWALGCVLYTLLCGFPPFYDEDIQVLTEKVANGQYTFLSPWWDDISDSAKDLISQLLTVDPSTRYTINDFFAHPWVQINTEKRVQFHSEVEEIDSTHPEATSPHESDDEFHPTREHVATPFHGPTLTMTRKDRHPMPLPVTPSISIKEAIDVSYAVYRMEDEEAAKQRFRIALQEQYERTNGSAHNHIHERSFLNNVDNSFDEEDINTINTAFQNAGMNNEYKPRRRGHLTPGPGVVSAEILAADKNLAEQNGNSDDSSSQGFELSLDQATLLSRRNRKADDSSSD